jgi:hypothetical protein
MASFTEAIAGRGELDKGTYLLQQTAGLAVGRRAYTVLEKSTLVAAWHCQALGSDSRFALQATADSKTQLFLLTAAPHIQVPPRAGVPFTVTGPDGAEIGDVIQLPKLSGQRVILQPRDDLPAHALEFGGGDGRLDNGGVTVFETPVRFGRGRNPADCLEIRIRAPLAPPMAALLFAGAFAGRVWNSKAAIVPASKAESKGGLWGVVAEVLGNLPG